MDLKRPAGKHWKKAVVLVSAAIVGVVLLSGGTEAQVTPQTVELAKIDVQKLSAGYRASKVIGSSVVNDAHEFIGKIDDPPRRQGTICSTFDRRLLGHGHSLGCRPLRHATVRRKAGSVPRRHQGRAQNAARVQVRNAVISAKVLIFKQSSGTLRIRNHSSPLSAACRFDRRTVARVDGRIPHPSFLRDQ